MVLCIVWKDIKCSQGSRMPSFTTQVSSFLNVLNCLWSNSIKCQMLNSENSSGIFWKRFCGIFSWDVIFDKRILNKNITKGRKLFHTIRLLFAHQNFGNGFSSSVVIFYKWWSFPHQPSHLQLKYLKNLYFFRLGQT